MDSNKRDKIDEMIESALAGETERDVPFGFHRRVDGRIRVAAMLQKEQRSFRRCWTLAAATILVLATGAGAVWYIGDVPGTVARAVPGVLGSYDQMVFVLAGHWPAMSASCAALLAGLATAYAVVRRSQAKPAKA